MRYASSNDEFSASQLSLFHDAIAPLYTDTNAHAQKRLIRSLYVAIKTIRHLTSFSILLCVQKSYIEEKSLAHWENVRRQSDANSVQESRKYPRTRILVRWWGEEFQVGKGKYFVPRFFNWQLLALLASISDYSFLFFIFVFCVCVFFCDIISGEWEMRIKCETPRFIIIPLIFNSFKHRLSCPFRKCNKHNYARIW